ncbi:MAG: hypothetical protein ACOCZZ_02350 [Bacillota bacterium]
MKIFKFLLVFCLSFIFIFSGSLSAQENIEPEEYFVSWEDHRIELAGEFFILDETFLNETMTEDEREEFSLYVSKRLTDDVMAERYSDEDIEFLNDYRGREINFEEILEITERFSVIGFKAARGFERDNAHEKVTIDLNEVVNISESSILSDPKSHTMLISNNELLDYSNARVLPNGEVFAAYILPKIDSEFLTVEFRSVLDNSYISLRATLEQRGMSQ